MTQQETRVRKTLEKIASELKFGKPEIEIKAISSGGANYTSQLFTAKVSEKNGDVIHTFVKVAAMGAKMREQTKLEYYNTEIFFYVDLLKSYRQIEERNGISTKEKLRVPIFYGANETYLEEVLVLENLVKKGFRSFNRFTTVNWQYAAAAVTELAKFHALSMAFEDQNPEKFKRANEEHRFPDFASDKAEFMFKRAVGNALDVVREENKAKLAEYLKTMDFNEFKRLMMPSRRPVLVHGDYRPSNMLHRTRDDSTIEVIPVDYQTLRGGCPVVDLFYFIFSGTDAQFRAHYYQQLLDHYYAELSAALTRLGLNPADKYSRDDFEFELKEKLSYGLAVAVFTLPIVTVEAENAPKVEEDMELSDFSIKKTSSLFPERLNGVVDDYVKWGVL